LYARVRLCSALASMLMQAWPWHPAREPGHGIGAPSCPSYVPSMDSGLARRAGIQFGQRLRKPRFQRANRVRRPEPRKGWIPLPGCATIGHGGASGQVSPTACGRPPPRGSSPRRWQNGCPRLQIPRFLRYPTVCRTWRRNSLGPCQGERSCESGGFFRGPPVPSVWESEVPEKQEAATIVW
jgi:hypothetical protein